MHFERHPLGDPNFGSQGLPKTTGNQKKNLSKWPNFAGHGPNSPGTAQTAWHAFFRGRACRTGTASHIPAWIFDRPARCPWESVTRMVMLTCGAPLGGSRLKGGRDLMGGPWCWRRPLAKLGSKMFEIPLVFHSPGILPGAPPTRRAPVKIPN